MKKRTKSKIMVISIAMAVNYNGNRGIEFFLHPMFKRPPALTV